MLEDQGFIRIHDSHVINIYNIDSYIRGKGGEIVMADKSRVPISARRNDKLAFMLKDIL